MRHSFASCVLACGLAQVPAAQWPLQPLTPPSSPVEDSSSSFGEAIATCVVDEVAWLFVGEPDSAERSGGGVHSYRQALGAWIYAGTLHPTSLVEGDRAGMQLVAQGQTLLVGTDPARTRGLFVFEYVDGDWAQTANLAPGAATSGYFGESTAVYGDLIAVSDTMAPGGRLPMATAHVDLFRRDDVLGTWSIETTLTPPPVLDGSLATISAVDVRSNGITADVLIACPSNRLFDGAVQLYHRDSAGVWSETESLVGDGSTGFATDAAFTDQGRLIIGVPGAEVNELADAGEARVFHPQISSPHFANWTLVQSVHQEPTPVADARFGERLRTGQRFLLAAAPGLNPGRACLFEHLAGVGGFWSATATLSTEDSLLAAGAMTNSEVLFGVTMLPRTEPGVVLRTGFPQFAETLGASQLQTAPHTIALNLGGTQCLQLRAGAEFAGRTYFIVGSASGATAQFPFQGFQIPLRLPDTHPLLNYFAYTLESASAGAPPLMQSVGVLDANGEARASFELPAVIGSPFAGVQLHHAFVVFEAVSPISTVAVSNASPLLLAGSLPPTLRLEGIAPSQSVLQSARAPVNFEVSVRSFLGAAAIAEYTWEFGDDSPIESTLVPTNTHIYAVGAYQGTVTVTDLLGSTASVDFAVENLTYPVAEAGADTLVASPGDSITLSGSLSYDPDGGAISAYCWSPNLPSCILTDTVDYTIPLDALPGTELSFNLVVIDDEFVVSPIPSNVTIVVR